jgi:osmoprotectant transport system ATP-binding protein
MLNLIDVSKSFGKTQVLEPTTLEFPQGQTTVLLGPSGCGKSTLLRIIVRLIVPDQGEVHFDGRPITSETLLLFRQQIGYVLQDGGLFPHLTSAQNVGLLASHLGWDKQRIHQRIDELAELTRLPHEALSRYPGQISGGQRQRVGIMRALMLDPDVILLDEPMGALDPLVRYDLQDDLKRIFQSLNKTVILVTHDLGEADFLGDQIVMLGHGRVIQRGTLQDLASAPADPFVTRFLEAQRVPDFNLESN